MPNALRHLLSLLLSILLLGAAAHSRASLLLTTPEHGTLKIGSGLQVLEDPGNNLSLQQAMQQTAWESTKESVFNRGYSASAWWIRFSLRNPNPAATWLLEIAYSPLDQIDLYLVHGNGNTDHTTMGDKKPFHERPIEHRYFVAPISMAQHDQIDVYLRLRSTGSVQAPMALWPEAEFYARDIGHTALQGLYYGGLLIIALYNLLVYTVLRERYYLYYVGWVVCMFWFMASINGWAFQFLWPYATRWNDVSIVASLALLVLFGYLFAYTFLGVRHWPKVFRWFNAVAVSGCLLLFMASLVLPYAMMGPVLIPFAAVGCLWGLVVGTVAIRRRVASATIYLVGWSMILVGGLILAMNKVHILPRNMLTDYAVQLGSLLEVLLLSFALAARINQERKLRLEAQQNALEVQRKANEELEQRVQERTQALEEANKKLRELSDTDQLTGLKNRRFLNLFIEKEFARAQRYRHSIAVLMIDVDHFKSVNDNYGHPLGDDCLQEVASRIRQEMRWPSDTAARYGGEEFCVVLPETNPEGAAIVAERIRAKIERNPIPTRAQTLSLTVSVGTHVAIPAPGATAADFIGRADAALYEAKQRGRNQVVTSEDMELN